MKKYLVLVVVVLCCTFFTAGALAQGSGKGLFIYWRGETECGKGVKEGFKEMGLNIELDEFSADKKKEILAAFLSKLDESKYDFIYTFGTTVTVMTAEKVKQTPIAFGMVTNPLKSGVIKSWESSGNNVTGVSHAIPINEQVDFILRMGSYQSIGMIYNPEEKNSVIAMNELEKRLSEKGVRFISAPVSEQKVVASAVGKLVGGKVDLVYLPSDSFVLSQRDSILAALNEKKIPTYGALEKYVEQGALIGIVASYNAVGKEVALKIQQVLQGKKPSEIPPEILPFKQQTIVVNSTTAVDLGVELPYVIVSQAKIIE